ncbi:MAG: sufD [Rhodospirillales bacterium]|nr:sufD [Rhodospirillales bacterium]
MSTALSTSPVWLSALRAEGAARFEQTGLPTQRQEAWKYTGLNRLKSFGFEPSPAGSSVAAPLILVEGTAHRLVFVNGRFDAAQSTIGTLPKDVVLTGLADLLRNQPERVEPLLGKRAQAGQRPMVALNTAWLDDGVVLIVPRGVAVDSPIEITFLAGDTTAACHPRLIISLGDNAEAVLVERHLGSAAGGLANQVAEIDLGAGANLRHYVLHAEPAASMAVETVSATVGRDAQYRCFALTAGGGLVRREVEVSLQQPGATAQVDGAYLVDGERHSDTTILIDHQAAHCSSRQTQKGVIDDDGRAVFQGKILVRPGAQKTDGYQLSQTLLLSPQAEIDVKPELEIHADDVKCSHGATVGRLDADALFFLRARGIPEAEARALLIQGFIGGALYEIDRPAVRESFGLAAADWLRGRSQPSRNAESTAS